MTPNKLREIMIRQGLSHNDMATIHDVSYRQVSHWLSGSYPIPRAVAMTMQAFDENHIDLDWIMEKVVLEMKEAQGAAS